MIDILRNFTSVPIIRIKGLKSKFYDEISTLKLISFINASMLGLIQNKYYLKYKFKCIKPYIFSH